MKNAMDLSERMNKLVTYATASLKANRDTDDAHLRTCRECADLFHLWDSEDRFPTWLSYVVQGIGRDLGVLS
jgi:hypothetical protein